jgi:hydroxymethylbilane synthase
MLPAPGQGAIAVETRAGDRAVELLRPLHDATTARCVEAERLVLKYLGGGCHLALGSLATDRDGILSLSGVYVADPHATPISPRTGRAEAATPAEAARRVADQLLAN